MGLEHEVTGLKAAVDGISVSSVDARRPVWVTSIGEFAACGVMPMAGCRGGGTLPCDDASGDKLPDQVFPAKRWTGLDGCALTFEPAHVKIGSRDIESPARNGRPAGSVLTLVSNTSDAFCGS
jgi:hypothetical protein